MREMLVPYRHDVLNRIQAYVKFQTEEKKSSQAKPKPYRLLLCVL